MKQVLLEGLSRRITLVVGLAAIVGVGCMSISVPPPTDDRAEKQFVPAAERGDRIAQYQLASSYRYGTSGMPRDPVKAALWMRRSAEAGNADAQFALGQMLLAGGAGAPPAPETALEWFRKAAATHLGSRLWLADQFYRGAPPLNQRDTDAARVLYLAAAGQSKLARQRLGQLAEANGGAGEALKWYLLANSGDDVARLEKTLQRPEIERAYSEAAGWKP